MLSLSLSGAGRFQHVPSCLPRVCTVRWEQALPGPHTSPGNGLGSEIVLREQAQCSPLPGLSWLGVSPLRLPFVPDRIFQIRKVN